MEERNRIKGIRENAVAVDENTYKQDQWVGLNGMILTGDMDGFTVQHITKRLQRRIYSGVVTPEGWIEPFLLQPVVQVESGQPALLPAQPVEVSS